MNTKQMVSLLGIHLGEAHLNRSTRLALLNDGQDSAIILLHTKHLEVLDTTVLKEPVDYEGKMDLTSLSSLPFLINKGFKDRGIKRYGITGRFSKKISFEQYKDYVTKQHVFTERYPKHYFRGNYVYVQPYSSAEIESGNITEGTEYYVQKTGASYTVGYDGHTYNDGDTFTGVSGVTTYTTAGTGIVIEATFIDLYYYRAPLEMKMDLTAPSSTTKNVNCELPAPTHRIIVGLACEDFIGRIKSARTAYEAALKKIDDLNGEFDFTDSRPDDRTEDDDTSDVNDYLDISYQGYEV